MFSRECVKKVYMIKWEESYSEGCEKINEIRYFGCYFGNNHLISLKAKDSAKRIERYELENYVKEVKRRLDHMNRVRKRVRIDTIQIEEIKIKEKIISRFSLMDI